MARSSLDKNRSNLCQARLSLRESTSHSALLRMSFVLMTLASATRGWAFKTGLQNCYRRPRQSQTALCMNSLAQTQADDASTTNTSPSFITPTDQSESSIQKPWKTLFDLQLPEGHCLGLRIDASQPNVLSPDSIAHDNHWIHTFLHPAEITYAMAQPSEYAQETFLLGRLAMRQALPQTYDHAILKDDHGRPAVPPQYLGSISHKRSIADGTTAVALLSPRRVDGILMGVGVDIEQSYSRKRSIAKKVLTKDELDQLGNVEGVTKDEEVLLRFSLKESLYKAMHPLICQYVGFQEAQVTPYSNGTASVEWNLKSGAHERFNNVTAHWRRMDDLFLSSASVTLGDHEECIMGEPPQ